MKKYKVYIAGPYTTGDPVKNTRRAIEAGDWVLGLGHTPFIPHMNLIWDIVCPHPSETWYNWDLEWLAVCDCLIRLPGVSPGGDAEVKRANTLGIPVFFGVNEFYNFLLRRAHEEEKNLNG